MDSARTWVRPRMGDIGRIAVNGEGILNVVCVWRVGLLLRQKPLTFIE